MGVAVLDGVVASAVGAIGIGQRDEPIDALGELAERQLLGMIEQHRRELRQSVAHPSVADHPGEPERLRPTDTTDQPRITEAIDQIDRTGETPGSARLGAGAVERRPEIGVDGAMPVDGREVAVLCDGDGCRQLGVEATTPECDLPDAVVERRIRQLHQTLEQIGVHVSTLSNICSI